MIVVGSNGHNGHVRHFGDGGIPIDKGLRDEQMKPCCKRIDADDWCRLDDGHESTCAGIGRMYGPVRELWSQHKGMSLTCGKVIGDAAICQWPRGHYGPCK